MAKGLMQRVRGINVRMVLAVLAVVLISVLVWRQLSNCGSSASTSQEEVPASAPLVENYEMIANDNVARAPSNDELLKQHQMQGPRCGITEGEMMGYKYQVPEELPSVESLMPEETACDSYYDPEAAQDVPYVFTYPLTGSITKTRVEQAGDIWRGDLSIPARDPRCDFKTIWNQGDQLLHGAFANYTYKSQELAGCDNKEVWVRNTPINVANEELIQDYE